MRADVPADGQNGNWAAFSNQAAQGNMVQTGIAYMTSVQNSELRTLTATNDGNAFSNRSILHRIPVRLLRTGGYWSPIGSPPNVRFCDVRKFSDGQEITIGSDVWKIFPMLRRQFDTTTAYYRQSNTYGYAFKKVP